MNFTKEYIKECDCKEIQGLRPKGKNHYDNYFICESYLWCDLMRENDFQEWVIHIHGISKSFYYSSCKGAIGQTQKKDFTSDYLWLPTGDNLDDEIERICKKTWKWYNWNYRVENGLDSSETRMRYYAFIVNNQDRPICGDTCAIIYNLLLAKIKLLKALLKETNG